MRRDLIEKLEESSASFSTQVLTRLVADMWGFLLTGADWAHAHPRDTDAWGHLVSVRKEIKGHAAFAGDRTHALAPRSVRTCSTSHCASVCYMTDTGTYTN